MIADISYPIFTITITNLVCFMREKPKLIGDLAPTLSPRHQLGPPGGLQLPQDPQLQPFLGLTKTDAPISFLYYSLYVEMNFDYFPIQTQML